MRCRAASQANAREEQLQSENAALKGEVAYLNKLLAIACSEPSSTSWLISSSKMRSRLDGVCKSIARRTDVMVSF